MKEKLLIGILIVCILYLIYILYHSLTNTTGCYIWYGSKDPRTKDVPCKLITEEYCEKLGCKKVVWSCGAPACLCIGE